MTIIDTNISKINELCTKHKVSKLSVFGSILTNRFQPNSDVDFIVDFTGIDLFDYADNFFNFKISLEKLLKRDVDLLEEKAIKNPYLLDSINSSKKLIYG